MFTIKLLLLCCLQTIPLTFYIPLRLLVFIYDPSHVHVLLHVVCNTVDITTMIGAFHVKINKRDVQRKNVENNADMSRLRAP